MGKQYVIRLEGDLYYRGESPYQGVSKDEASVVERKDMDRIVSGLRKLGYQAYSEEVK